MDKRNPKYTANLSIQKVEHFANDRSTIHVSHVTSNERAKTVGIFWDLQNCCVPKGKSVLELVEKIRKTFIPEDSEFELKTFACVCDTKKESQMTIKDLNSGTVSILHVDADAKNAADEKIKGLMDEFVKDAPTGSKVVLISSDVNFSDKLSHFKNKCKLQVALVHEEKANPALLQHATQTFRWEDLTHDLSDRSGYLDTSDPILIIDGYKISSSSDKEKIKLELEILTQPWKGKVQPVGNKFTIVSLDDKNNLESAKNTINGKTVLGQIINVALLEESCYKTAVEKQINANKQGVSETKLSKNERKGSAKRDTQTNLLDIASESASVCTTLVREGCAKKGAQPIPSTVENAVRGFGLFWDFESCSVQPGQISITLQTILHRFCLAEFRLIENLCVCDVRQQPDLILKEMADCQLKTVHSIENPSDTMKNCLLDFNAQCGVGTKVVVISGKPEELRLTDMKHNKKVYIVLIHNIENPTICLDLFATQHLMLSELFQPSD
ncbi:meiosis regulator and mRNA stability factor 1-like [Physella acuta]|uniref:meiosis regulator and mRNA stability factor 1-like n=1 Tax=Physella acuta TaxID=109671 RepID=UPI0027DD6D95|nr:meiosis regulator and mRNA stability factor 1-like [Physella acuta]